MDAMAGRDSYPSPLMNEYSKFSSDGTVFADLDTNSGYQIIKVGKADGDKKTFTFHRELIRSM